jgi:hypothetical protein
VLGNGVPALPRNRGRQQIVRGGQVKDVWRGGMLVRGGNWDDMKMSRRGHVIFGIFFTFLWERLDSHELQMCENFRLARVRFTLLFAKHTVSARLDNPGNSFSGIDLLVRVVLCIIQAFLRKTIV